MNDEEDEQKIIIIQIPHKEYVIAWTRERWN